MTLTIRLFASLRKTGGGPAIQVPAERVKTARDLVEAICSQNDAFRAVLLDESGSLSDSVQLLVNGRNVRFLDGLATSVTLDDDLVLIPPVAGG